MLPAAATVMLLINVVLTGKDDVRTMAIDWFEKNVFKRTVQEILIDALNERNLEFHKLDVVVQTTLLDEAAQIGVQQSLELLMSLKSKIKSTNGSEEFQEMVLREIYRERGRTLSKEDQA
jgi:hypothetical protein